MLWRLMALTVFCLFHFCGLCRADDCGLRGFDGNQIVHFECEEGTPTSRFRVTTPSGETRGVVLVDIDQPGASRFRVRYNEADGTPVIKALGHISPGIAIDSCEELQMIGYLKAYPLDASYHLSQDIDCAATNPTNSAHSKSLWGLGYATRFPKGWDGKAESGDESVPELAYNQLGNNGFKPIGFFAKPIASPSGQLHNVSGSFDEAFTGSFDGKGNSIRNLYVFRHVADHPTSLGLFSASNMATFQNVHLFNVYMDGGISKDWWLDRYTGALVGFCEKTNIFNCHLQGEDPSTSGGTLIGNVVGGLIGRARSSEITNCSANAHKVKGQSAGGLAGMILEANLSNCHSSANMGGPGDYTQVYVGGLVGAVTLSSTLNQCSASGDILAGNDTFAVGPLSAGGLVGQVNGSVTINQCYAKGAVNVTNFDSSSAGGFIGLCFPMKKDVVTIKNSYSISPAITIRTALAGGVIGGGVITYGSVIIENCYSTAPVSSTAPAGLGGFFGNDYGLSVSYKNNFWYNDTNTHDTGTGDRTGVTKATPSDFYGEGLGTGKSVYSNWDFTNVWKSRSGNYPCLRWDKNCY